MLQALWEFLWSPAKLLLPVQHSELEVGARKVASLAITSLYATCLRGNWTLTASVLEMHQTSFFPFSGAHSTWPWSRRWDLGIVRKCWVLHFFCLVTGLHCRPEVWPGGAKLTVCCWCIRMVVAWKEKIVFGCVTNFAVLSWWRAFARLLASRCILAYLLTLYHFALFSISRLRAMR